MNWTSRCFAFLIVIVSMTGAALGADLTQGATANLYEADFMPGPAGIRMTSLPARVLDASPALTFPAANRQIEHCSSVVISDTGNILTAGHCIIKCMSDNDALREVPQDSNDILLRVVDLTQRDTKAPIVCDATVNGQRMKMQVLAAKGCVLEGERTSEAYIKAKGYCLSELDFAILHPIGIFKKHLPCLKVGYSGDVSGQDMLTIGFPSLTRRRKSDAEALDSDGKSQYVSFGTFVRSDTCTEHKNRNVHPLNNAHLLSKYLQYSADSVEGSSGGPIILRDDGKFVGVGTRAANSADLWCEGASFGISLIEIANDLLEAKMTKAQISDLYACEKDAAVRGDTGQVTVQKKM